MQTIYLDLDGTVYDLYGQPRWLERITTEKDPAIFAQADAALVDMVALQDVLFDLVRAGYAIGVLSWVPPMNLRRDGSPIPATREWKNAARAGKKWWVKRFLPMATEVHIVQYGTPKHHVASDKNGILVDDTAEVRAAWKGQTIDPTTCNIIDALRGLL